MPVAPLKLIKPNALTPAEFRQYKVICAALHCKYHEGDVHYGGVRGAGLKSQFKEPDIDVYPTELDCSGFIAYCYVVAGCGDFSPGASEGNVSTRTLWESGAIVGGPGIKLGALEPGDLIFFSYDPGSGMVGGNSEHVIMYMDNGLAMGMGSEHGPNLQDWNEGNGKTLVGARRYRF